MVYSSFYKCPIISKKDFFLFLIKKDFQYNFFVSHKSLDLHFLFFNYYCFINLYQYNLAEFKEFILFHFVSKNKNILTLIEQKLETIFFSLSKGYFCFLEVRGRNFKVLYLKKYLIFIFGFSHFILYPIPKYLLIFNIQQRSTLITFFSKNLKILKNFLQNLFNLKKKDVYKGKGLFFFKETFLLKIGKKKDFF